MANPQNSDAAFVRLHAPVRKGYRADLGVKSDTGFVHLEHPRGASVGAPSLLLCSDGRVISSDNVRPLTEGRVDPDCIYVESESDVRKFQSFLHNVPAPTVFQSLNAMTIGDLKMKMFSHMGFLFIGITIICVFLLFSIWLIRFVAK